MRHALPLAPEPELRTEALTGFVGGLRGAVVDALGALLGEPGGVRWLDGDGAAPEDTFAVVLSGAPALTVELRRDATGARCWARAGALTLSYRPLEGGADPFARADTRGRLEALRARLQALPSGATERAWDALCEARARAVAYRPVGDWLYRQASPHEVVLRLGFRCNQRCGFCWQSREWPDAPEALYHQWVDEVAAAGRRAVCFSGGEPTLHPALPALVARARDQGLRVMLQTNAVRLAREDYLQPLLAAGLRAVFVSYHSHLPEVSDAMTRAPGTHARTEEGLRRCLEAGLEVSLNTVVERANHAHLPTLAEAITTRFVAPFPSNPVATVSLSHPSPYYLRELWAGASVSLEVLGPLLLRAAQHLEAHGVTVEGLGTCGFPACVFREAPRLLRRATLAHEDLHDQEGRAYGARCAGCAARHWCLGVKRDYLHEHGEDALVPFARDPLE